MRIKVKILRLGYIFSSNFFFLERGLNPNPQPIWEALVLIYGRHQRPFYEYSSSHDTGEPMSAFDLVIVFSPLYAINNKSFCADHWIFDNLISLIFWV